MKHILKFKKNLIILSVLLSFALSTEAAFERREDRLSRRSNQTLGNVNNEIDNPYKSSNFRGGGMGLGDDPNEGGGGPIGGDDSNDGPIGDAFPLLLGLGLAYGIYAFYRKEKESVE